MNDAVIAVLLGVIEGLTEFLPVSSTAHLRLAEKMFDLPLDDPYWKMFAIVIQLGAILSLFVYFSGRLMRLVGTFPQGETKDQTVLTHPLTLVVVAFVVTAIPAKLLTKVIGENLESMKVIGASLLIGGIIMWVVDAIYGGKTQHGVGPKGSTQRVEEMNLAQAIWVGACQILSAVFPGTSRSMSTIAGAQVVGLSRPAALEFSFLLSIPTMLAATGYALFKMVRGKSDVGGHGLAHVQMDGHRWAILAIGTVVSFIVALGVVAWFMSWVRRRGFVPFAAYRIILGIAVLIWAYRGMHA